MKELVRICTITILVYIFLITPAASAFVAGGGQALAVLSEPGTMIMLGSSLIGFASFVRRKVLREK